MLLTKEQILQANDLETRDVDVPEWGGTVRVRGLTGHERDQYEAGIIQMKGASASVRLENLRARLVALSVIGEDGDRLFTTDDVRELGGKSASALERVFDAARDLSGLKSRDVKELAEGFENGPGEPSASDSPPSSE